MRRLIPLILLCHALLAHGQDAYLNTSFVPRYWKANEPWTISARVRNATSSAPLITFRVDWRFSNGPIHIGPSQATTGILPGQYWPYTHPDPFTAPASGGVLKVWVVGTGDAQHANDTLFFPVEVLDAWATKSVLVEEYTGTWCQFSPPVNITVNGMDQDPLIVVAKHHMDDEFSSASSTAYWQQYNAEYSPAGVVEQGEFGTLPANGAYDQWPAQAEQRKQGVSPASIAISAEFNEWQGDLTIGLDVTFTAALAGDFVVNAYIVEDNVPGPQTAAGSSYLHQQVVREVLGGPTGTSGVIPATTAAGATYSHQFTYSVPEAWNPANLRVVATVTERRNGTSWTVNAADAHLVSVGIAEGSAGSAVGLYPNPASESPWLLLDPRCTAARACIATVDGRTVREQALRPDEGRARLRTEGLAPGTYLVLVEAGGQQAALKLLLQP